MSSAGFQMLVEEGGKSEFRHVSLPDVIAAQRMYVRELLSSILTKLQREVEEHKERFRMVKLVDCFTSQIGYAFEKLSQGVHASGPNKAGHAHMGLWGLEHIRDVLASVQEALAKREIELDAYPGIGYLYGEVRYPIQKLEAFLESKKTCQRVPIDEEAATIFVSFLRTKLNELRDMAREIDEDYERET
jgi:hypothetical protein